MPKICPKYTRVAWQHDTDKHRVNVSRLRCGQWSCEFCAKLNRRQWLFHLRRKLPEIGAEWWLVTFTAGGGDMTRWQSYKRLQRGIDVFFKTARRTFGKVEYVRVFERHSSRVALHAHIILWGVTPFVSVGKSRNGKMVYTPLLERAKRKGTWALRTFVKKIAQRSGMGFIADARRVDNVRATRYVTKYLTKDMQAIDIKGLRHIQTTRGIGSPKQDAGAGWYVGYRLNKTDIHGDEQVYDTNTGKLIPHSYWKDGNVYPPLNDKDGNEL